MGECSAKEQQPNENTNSFSHYAHADQRSSVNKSVFLQEKSSGPLKPFLSRSTNFDLATPFRLEDLRGRNTTSRIGIKYRIDNVAAARLENR